VQLTARRGVRRALLLALLPLTWFAGTGSAFAQTRPAVGDKYATIAGIQLGSVNLSDVVRRFGPAAIVTTGSGDDYEASVCYRVSGGVLAFLANNLGGVEHRLLGYRITETAATGHCAPIANGRPEPSLDSAGLHLGLSSGEFDRLMHTPAIWRGASVGDDPFAAVRHSLAARPRAWRSKTAAGGENIFFFRHVSVSGTFADGVLVGFEVWETEGP
jgi:hypothetical protein